MTDNGLILSKNEFKRLPTADKFACLYENQVKTLKLIEGYKFHQKVQYILIAASLAGLGILFKIALGV